MKDKIKHLRKLLDNREYIQSEIAIARWEAPSKIPDMVIHLHELEYRIAERIADIVAKFHIIPVSGIKLRQEMPVANGAW